METKVFNLIILDESGSMSCIERQALSGLNETLQTIRSAQKKHPELKQIVSILPFNTDHLHLLRDRVAITEVDDLKTTEYNPLGGTPLYDAIGIGVGSIRASVGENDSVLVTIITDGCENSSREYNSRSISKLIESLKQQGWMFTYIGANQDAEEVASQICIDNALNFDQSEEGTKVMFSVEAACRDSFMDAMADCASLNIEEAKARRVEIAHQKKFFDR
ncbi:MAG: VWA domain-containing protein [Bacteroidales bacterium]|nr:VWA domain-containing protein [Bacteroidales bacterium]